MAVIWSLILIWPCLLHFEALACWAHSLITILRYDIDHLDKFITKLFLRIAINTLPVAMKIIINQWMTRFRFLNFNLFYFLALPYALFLRRTLINKTAFHTLLRLQHALHPLLLVLELIYFFLQISNCLWFCFILSFHLVLELYQGVIFLLDFGDFVLVEVILVIEFDWKLVLVLFQRIDVFAQFLYRLQ